MKIYDFTSYYRRRNGSKKWLEMNKLNEDPREGVVPMTMADMDFPTCPKIIHAIQKYTSTEVLGYSDPTNAYLDSVIEFFKEKHNYTIKKEWLVTAPGIV